MSVIISGVKNSLREKKKIKHASPEEYVELSSALETYTSHSVIDEVYSLCSSTDSASLKNRTTDARRLRSLQFSTK